jgi:hypothetical protein
MAARSLFNHSGITAVLLRSHCAIAAQAPHNRCSIDSQSFRTYFTTPPLSPLHSSFVHHCLQCRSYVSLTFLTIHLSPPLHVSINSQQQLRAALRAVPQLLLLQHSHHPLPLRSSHLYVLSPRHYSSAPPLITPLFATPPFFLQSTAALCNTACSAVGASTTT